MAYHVHPCPEQEYAAIYRGIREYNTSQVPMTQREAFIPLSRKVVDDAGYIIAGCIAEMYFWKIAYVDILWVAEAHRHQGLGRQLLTAVEDAARQEGCTLIHLDTFDFQARDFYLKLGYEVFGTLENCPEGHCRYYLKKRLI